MLIATVVKIGFSSSGAAAEAGSCRSAGARERRAQTPINIALRRSGETCVDTNGARVSRAHVSLDVMTDRCDNANPAREPRALPGALRFTLVSLNCQARFINDRLAGSFFSN